MMVFIGWAGERSGRVAVFLRGWLKQVIKDLEVWVSAEDIETGKPWLGKLNAALKQADVGVLCITAENLEALWITYEAGSLANKAGGETSVCPYVIDLYLSRSGNLPLTLNQFEAVKADYDGTKKLVRDISKALGEKLQLTANALNEFIEAAEGDFENKWRDLKDVLEEVQGIKLPPQRTVKDIIDEDNKLSDDFKEVRGLIDSHEAHIADKLFTVIQSVTYNYRKDEPFDLDGITKRAYGEIERNLSESIMQTAFCDNGSSVIVGDVRKFFLETFPESELGGILEFEFQPILKNDSLSSESKISPMLELLMEKKKEIFSRLHKVLAAKLVDYLKRESR